MKDVCGQESEKLLSDGIELGSFRVRLAQTNKDKDEVFKLRYQIFNEELGEGIPENEITKRDVDKFDEHCDHLIVEKGGLIIGSYRMLPYAKSLLTDGFYSESEFSIRKLPIDLTLSVETGRASVSPDHRKQATLLCLFVGIRHYMNLIKARYIFGMASLAKMSHESANATYEEIKQMGKTIEFPGVGPIDGMKIPEGIQGGVPEVPPLLAVYFKVGASICSKPAYDPIFKCHDLLTLSDITQVPDKTWNLFGRFVSRKNVEEKI